MGAEPWMVFTPYRENPDQALLEVQHREFDEGNYDPHGILAAEGIEPASIEEVREIMEDSGTGTVLDVLQIAERPQFMAAACLPANQLTQLYGTAEPTREMVDANQDFFDDLDRGESVFFVVYQDGQPAEYVFAGYSVD